MDLPKHLQLDVGYWETIRLVDFCEPNDFQFWKTLLAPELAQSLLQGEERRDGISVAQVMRFAFEDTNHYLWQVLRKSTTAHVIDFLISLQSSDVAKEVILKMVASKHIQKASAIMSRMLGEEKETSFCRNKHFALGIAKGAPEILNICNGQEVRLMSDLVPASTMRKDCPAGLAILKEKYVRSLLTLHLVLKPCQRRDSTLIIGVVKEFLSPYTFFATHWRPEDLLSSEPEKDAVEDSRAYCSQSDYSYYSDYSDYSGSDYSEPSEDVGEEETDNAPEVVEEPNMGVVQDIVHNEPAVPPDPSDALIADELWARSVEHVITQDAVFPNHERGSGSAIVNESVYLLHFKRYPDSFRKALVEGEALQECRCAMEEAHCPWHLPESGAKVFVHPSQYQAALEAVLDRGIQLRPYHVIVSDSLEALVHEALTGLPCRQGARVRVRDELLVARDVSSSETSIGEHPAESTGVSASLFLELGVERTFIGLVRPRRDAESVTQSTTEAHGGLNPRRLTLLTLSDE